MNALYYWRMMSDGISTKNFKVCNTFDILTTDANLHWQATDKCERDGDSLEISLKSMHLENGIVVLIYSTCVCMHACMHTHTYEKTYQCFSLSGVWIS